MDSETFLEDDKSSLTMAEAVETIKQLRKVFNIVYKRSKYNRRKY